MPLAVDAISAATVPVARERAPEPIRNAALSFEQLLLEQLAAALTQTTRLSGEADGATAFYAQLIPGALAESLRAAGGLGVGDELARALRAREDA